MKKLYVCVMIIAVLASGMSFADVDPYKPLVGIEAGDEVQVIEAGKPSEYVLSLKNPSYVSAQNLQITFKGTHPFRSDITNLTKYISSLNPNQVKQIPFKVTASPTAEAKIYEFDVQIDYINFNGTAYSTVEKAYVKVENKNVEPILGIVEYSTGQKYLTADAPDALTMKITNSGTLTAKDVKVTASGFSNEGVVLYQEVDTKALERIDAKETALVYFNIIAGRDAKEGTFPLTVDVTYNDDMGKAYKKTFVCYVSLVGKGSLGSDLKIYNIKAPSAVAPDGSFDVTYTVANIGKSVIKSAEVTFDYREVFVAKRNSRVVVKDLLPGAEKTFTINMAVRKEATKETYHNYIKASYVPQGGSADKPETAQEYVGLYVSEGSDSGSKPKLIVEKYDFGGEYAYAGSDFPLTVTIKNTSKAEGTKNIKVTLSSEESVFTPVDSSSSFFIPAIGPGQTHTQTVKLKTKIDANVKIYTLTAKMAYEDGKGQAYDANKTPYEESEVLSIAVAQPVRLETGNLNLPGEIFVGQPFYFEQEFYNMGKSTMYNMMIKIEGVSADQSNYFVGNFEAGKSDRFSTQITPEATGDVAGKLIYTFEDALGTVSTVEKAFSFTVAEMPPMPGPGEPGMPGGDEMPPADGNQGMALWQKLLIAGAVIVGAIIVIVVVKKRARNKELEDFDDRD